MTMTAAQEAHAAAAQAAMAAAQKVQDTDWSIWGPALAILALIIISAFFSASETAMTAASRARMHTLEKEGNKRAGLVNLLRQKKDRLIGTLLLGNNFVNVLAASLTTSVFIKIFNDDTAIFYATGIITALILIFSEVLPKTYALLHADKLALGMAPLIKVIVWVLNPVVLLVARIVSAILALFGVRTDQDNMISTEDELRGAIELHKGDEEKTETQAKRAMLRSILDLADVEVGEIMTHRQTVETVDAGQPVATIIEQVLDNAYTRLPVFRDTIDNIIGILHAKSLLRELNSLGGDFSKVEITKLLTVPWYIPDTTTLQDQLEAFRARKEHFAIVVDEYGTFKGIVTLEDILEEIVGDIDDEHDITVPGVRPQPNGSYIVDGTVTIRDLNRAYDWVLPDEDYSTIAGLVLHESKMIPDIGQNFSFYGFRFKILKRQRNQITLIRITPEQAKTSES